MAERAPYCPHCGGRLGGGDGVEGLVACPHCGGALREADKPHPAPPPHRTAPRAPSLGETMLREFESQRARGRRPGRRRGLLVGAAAGGLLLAAILLIAVLRRPEPRTSVSPPPPPPPSTKVGTGAPDPDERNAEVLFRRAERAAGLKQWANVLEHLDGLLAKYAQTRFVADRAGAIAALRAQAEKGLEGTVVVVKPPDPVPPPPPPPTMDEALRTWPIAFQDALDSKACLERAWLFRGQYGGHFHIHNGGLAISGVHTNSACWWNCLVGDSYAVSLDFYFAGSVPFILLSGPGYGSHPAVGYALRLPVQGNALAIELRRHGALVGLPMRVAPFRAREWHRLDVLRDRERIAVRLDGEMLGEWQDPEPLRGAMHAFVGLGSELGMWGDDRPHFRNLAIRMPKDDADRLAKQPIRRVLDPPITVPPQANGEPLFVDDFAEGAFSRWTAVQRADAAKVRNGKLELRGPNAWPAVWRDEPVTGSAAVEFRMAYLPNCEAVNFNARLRLGDYPVPEKRTVFHGWQLGFPGGNGEVCLSWADRQGKGRVMARTAYFPAMHGRPYTLRLELSGRMLRVFVNDGFLLEGVAPERPSPDMGVYPGLFQIYGGSLVERVEAWRIADLPEPGLVAGVAAPGTDFGPRLAAGGSYWAAFEARVCPLLADRAYDKATKAAEELGQRTEFRLAAELAQLSRRDVARLARFWAAVQEQVAGVLHEPRLDLTQPETRLQAALFVLFDRHGDPKRALEVLGPIADTEEARRYCALVRRAAAARE